MNMNMNMNNFIRRNAEGQPRWFINSLLICDHPWLHNGLIGLLTVIVFLNSPWWAAASTLVVAVVIDHVSLLKGWKKGVQDALENPDDFKNL